MKIVAYSHDEAVGTADPKRRHLARLDLEGEPAYWIRFLNGRWLIHWHERLIGDFPAENAVLALAFLRQKQSELAANTHWVTTPCADDRSAVTTGITDARPNSLRIPPPARP